MATNFSRFIKASVFTLVLLALFWSLSSVSNIPEHFQHMSCTSCHLSSQPKGSEKESVLLINSQEVLCGKCHAQVIKTSHPSGLIPRKRTPKEYPLDWKGELTCSSCHHIHGNQPGLLRTNKRGKEHCLSCHEMSFFGQMADKGASLVEKTDDSRLPSQVREALDPLTKKCLSCHEKQTKAYLVSLNRYGILEHNSSSMSHPIGRSYEKAETFGGYRPQSQLDEKIILPDGKISCLSCHKNYSSEHGKLIETKQGSRLCFLCHDL